MRRDDIAALLLRALDTHDESALDRLLDSGVRLTIDAGDWTGGTRTGRHAVGRALEALVARHRDAALHVVQVNGAPGLALRRPDGDVVAVMILRTGWRGAIAEAWLTTAPDKLARWNRTA